MSAKASDREATRLATLGANRRAGPLVGLGSLEGEHRYLTAELGAVALQRVSSCFEYRNNRRDEKLGSGIRAHGDLKTAAGHLFHTHHFNCAHANGTGDVVSVTSVYRDEVVQIGVKHDVGIGAFAGVVDGQSRNESFDLSTRHRRRADVGKSREVPERQSLERFHRKGNQFADRVTAA